MGLRGFVVAGLQAREHFIQRAWMAPTPVQLRSGAGFDVDDRLGHRLGLVTRAADGHAARQVWHTGTVARGALLEENEVFHDFKPVCGRRTQPPPKSPELQEATRTSGEVQRTSQLPELPGFLASSRLLRLRAAALRQRERCVADVLEPAAPAAVVAAVGPFDGEEFLQPLKSARLGPIDRVRMTRRAPKR